MTIELFELKQELAKWQSDKNTIQPIGIPSLFKNLPSTSASPSLQDISNAGKLRKTSTPKSNASEV